MADKQINIRLKEDEHLALKLACTKAALSIQQVVHNLIRVWVLEQKDREQAEDLQDGR